MSLCSVLFVVFFVLKLLHLVSWSWWWVTAPLWIPGCVAVGYYIVVGIFVGVVRALVGKSNNKIK